jgi:hypothetical protein
MQHQVAPIRVVAGSARGPGEAIRAGTIEVAGGDPGLRCDLVVGAAQLAGGEEAVVLGVEAGLLEVPRANARIASRELQSERTTNSAWPPTDRQKTNTPSFPASPGTPVSFR